MARVMSLPIRWWTSICTYTDILLTKMSHPCLEDIRRLPMCHPYNWYLLVKNDRSIERTDPLLSSRMKFAFSRAWWVARRRKFDALIPIACVDCAWNSLNKRRSISVCLMPRSISNQEVRIRERALESDTNAFFFSIGIRIETVSWLLWPCSTCDVWSLERLRLHHWPLESIVHVRYLVEDDNASIRCSTRWSRVHLGHLSQSEE